MAIKKISCDQTGIAQSAYREQEALQHFENYDCFVHLENIYFEDLATIFVLELCECDLSSMMKTLRDADRLEFMTTERRLSVAKQMFRALALMHGDKFAHRDIKLSNFLISPEGMIKLSDFGLAVKTVHGIVLQECGSDHYISPECLFGVRQYVMESDMFAAGMVLLNLLCGCDDEDLNFYDIINGCPKEKYSQMQMCGFMQRVIGTPSVQQVRYIPDSYMQMCFCQLGSEPTPGDLDAIMTEYHASPVESAIIKGLLTWDPCERLSAAQCLQMLEKENVEQVAIPMDEYQQIVEEKKRLDAIPLPMSVVSLGNEDAPLAGLDDSLFRSNLCL